MFFPFFAGGTNKSNVSNESANNSITFKGVLKYNSVFVTDESLQRLTERGFGAKRFRPLPPSRYDLMQKKKEGRKQDLNEDRKKDVRVDENLSTSPRYPVISAPTTPFTADSVIPTPSSASASTASGSEKSKIKQKAEEEFEDSGPLLLFDEEAFYLFENKYLVLDLLDGSRVSLQQLWNRFLEKNKNFPIKYKVYSYFRDLGYVVKTGIHYGLDYAVYRTLPSMCHSEICAMVVDATVPFDVSDGVPSKCQQGWRHISTLTRVMPDVMKLMTMCYVFPTSFVAREGAPTLDPASASDPPPTLCNEDVLREIFTGYPSALLEVPLDYSSPAVLDQLVVRPVTTLVRRLACKGEGYQTIRDVQTKYRSCSILKAPRVQQMSKKKRRKRRDHAEVRLKAAGKHNKIWKELMTTPGGEGAAGNGAKSNTVENVSNTPVDSMSRSAEKRQKKKLKEAAKLGNMTAAGAASQQPSLMVVEPHLDPEVAKEHAQDHSDASEPAADPHAIPSVLTKRKADYASEDAKSDAKADFALTEATPALQPSSQPLQQPASPALDTAVSESAPRVAVESEIMQEPESETTPSIGKVSPAKNKRKKERSEEELPRAIEANSDPRYPKRTRR